VCVCVFASYIIIMLNIAMPINAQPGVFIEKKCY